MVLYFVARIIRVLRQITLPAFTRASGRRLALFCAAVGSIAVTEAVIPSTRMTGLERSQTIEPPREMDQQPFGPAGLTFGDVAQSADWLWPLGSLTRPDMQARLEADVVMAQDQWDSLVAKEAEDFSFAYRMRARQQIYVRYEVLVEGLQRALAGLDDLFTAPQVSGLAADKFVLAALAAARSDIGARAEAQYRDLVVQLAEFNDPNIGQQTLDQDPAYVALRDQVNAARDLSVAVSLSTLAFDRVYRSRGGLELAVDVTTPFPAFAAPMPLFDVSHPWTPLNDAAAQIGPRVGFANFVQFQDALTGRLRHDGLGISAADCRIAITDGVLERLCEISVPMKLNYDLTGVGCQTRDFDLVADDKLTARGTQVSAEFCKESWIYPHLTIVFAGDRFTVHPPRPASGAGLIKRPAPISLWQVEWEGDTRVLEGPETFAWAGGDSNLPKLIVTHGVRPEVRGVKIWRDFRRNYPWASVPDMIMGNGDNRFVPVTYGGFRHQFNVVEGFVLGGQQDQAVIPTVTGLDTEISRRQRAIQALSSDLRREVLANTHPSLDTTLCNLGIGLRLNDFERELKSSIMAYVTAASGNRCEAYYSYITILQLFERWNSAGSWLWMLKT